MAGLADYRAKYPQYNDLTDEQLAKSLHDKFYSDMDPAEFNQKIGLSAPQPTTPNTKESVLPGAIGQFQNTSNAIQSGFNQGMTFGFGDELYSAATAPLRAIGPALQGQGYDIGRAYNDELQYQQRDLQENAALNPTANAIGEIGGAITTGGALAKGGLSLTARAAKPLAIAGAGALEGALYGGTYAAGKSDGDLGQRLDAAKTGALTGAALGAVAPTIANAIGGKVAQTAQRAATTKAINAAPDAATLRAQSSNLFQSVDNSGVTIDTPKFSQFVNDIATRAKRDRINPTLDPKATAAYQELIGALADVQAGQPMTLSQLHTLRQIAQKAAVSAEGRDSMFANRIVDGLDTFITQPGAVTLPPNRIGAGNAPQNDLLEAISTWGRSRRVGLVEEAIYKAGNQASGLENGLRVHFRALLQNPRTRNLFTQAERQAIEEVANGTGVSNLARLIGKFGFGGGSASNMLGGTTGASIGFGLGGPLGSIAAAVLGTGAKKASELLAKRAATRAAQVVATPNIPQVQLPSNALLPVSAPLAVETYNTATGR